MAKSMKKKTSKRRKADPVITEIIRNGVIAVTEEMKTNLMRTAYNMIIYEALDFTTGLFTPEGETVSIGIGLPTFIRGMAETVKAKIRHFGIENMKPGDIYVTNDSYTTGSHLNHFTFTLPIFHKGKLVGFACCMAHWLDVGGVLGGMTTDIYSEGIQIPIVKYQDRGKVNQDLLDIIRMNVRLPPRAMGDLRAQVTAVKTGERLFLQLIERYGREEVAHAIREIMDHAEVAARARTKTIPDGVYEAESSLDDDGIDVGKRIPIKRQGHRQGRRDDHRPHRCREAGARLLQLGDHHRLWLRPGRLQVHHLADRLSDQRRRVPQPQGDHPAGPHRQRDAAGADAAVDVLSDDHHRHDLQGAAEGDPRPRHRRPSRRPGGAELPRLQSAIRRSSSSPTSARSAAAGAPRRPRTASPRPSASTTATPTTARTSRPRPSIRSWSSASS